MSLQDSPQHRAQQGFSSPLLLVVVRNEASFSEGSFDSFPSGLYV